MKLIRSIPLFLTAAMYCFILPAQDTIVFENQYPFLVDIVQESDVNVYYQKYDVDTSATYVIEKRFISDLLYQYPEERKSKFRNETFTINQELSVWVTPADSVGQIKGLLHHLDDSMLVLRKKPGLFTGGKAKSRMLHSLPYDRIFRIEVRKRNKIRQYAFWGAAIGFVSGTITGLSVFEDSPPCDPITNDGRDCDDSLSSPRNKWEKSLMAGFAGAGGGFVIGGAIGSVKVKIPIGGRKDVYNGAVARLRRMARMQGN